MTHVHQKFARAATRMGLSLVLAFATTAAVAQVRAVEGTVSDGAQVRIVGSGFGTKPFGAKPYAFWDFGKGESRSSQYSRNAWHEPVIGVLDAAVVANRRAAAWRCKIDTAQVGSEPGSQYDCWAGDGRYGDQLGMQLNTSARDYYLFSRLYYNWDGADAYARRSNWNLKGFRFWGDTNLYVFGAGQSSDPDGSVRTVLEGGTPGADVSYPAPISRFGIKKNVWRVEEHFVRQSSANNATDGLWRARSDRVLTGPYTSGSAGNLGEIVNMRTRTSAPFNKLAWHQAQYHGFQVGDGKYIAYDVVYIDDSWARVIVTDSATWSDTAATTAQEIQIPMTWSDGAIDVVLRAGVLGSLTGKYLYVFKADGSPVSLSGFALGPAAPAPNPPSAFSAN